MTARGCCNAELARLLQRLKARAASESNPEVRRGIEIAIWEAKKCSE